MSAAATRRSCAARIDVNRVGVRAVGVDAEGVAVVACGVSLITVVRHTRVKCRPCRSPARRDVGVSHVLRVRVRSCGARCA